MKVSVFSEGSLRASELALRRWRSAHRSWLTYAILLFIVAAWAVIHQTLESASDCAAAVFFVSGLCVLAIGSGAIAREFESGVMVLDRLHGARPVDVVLGTAIYATTFAMVATIVTAGLIFATAPEYLGSDAILFLLVVALGLMAWVAFLVLLGSFVPGSGNATIALGLIVVLAPVSRFDRPDAAPVARMAARLVTTIFPPETVFAFFRAADHAALGSRAIAVALSTAVFLALAIGVVAQREPAHGWKR